ncbi:MAG: DnaJ domain-containing protein [Chlorobi bacterium]|nr:DnaJ domain-containing protein [Chlorobiota bacterium]
MARLGKWIAGGLGWAFFGPLGGILGFVLGSLFEENKIKPGDPNKTTPAGFTMSLLVLLAAVMKADGKVVKSELEYVKKYLIQTMGEERAKEASIYLRDILKQEIPVRDIAMQIKQHLDYSSRLQLLHLLFGLSAADNVFHPSEVDMIRNIAGFLGISSRDFESIRHMFLPDTDAAYRILGVERTATDEEIKKAFRTMAVKYHPDKVSYLGEAYQKVAKEKFQKINDAYATIKKERGMA